MHPTVIPFSHSILFLVVHTAHTQYFSICSLICSLICSFIYSRRCSCICSCIFYAVAHVVVHVAAHLVAHLVAHGLFNSNLDLMHQDHVVQDGAPGSCAREAKGRVDCRLQQRSTPA